jgi:TctA family transporter
MIWVLIVSNIITVAISFLFLRQIAQVTRIRGSLLIPVLLLFIFLGSYTHSNNFGDIVVMLLFGALGCFMVAFGWSRPALLLGLVLGRLTDNYLWLSYARYEFEFLARPGVMAIIALVIVTVLYPAVKKRWRKQ